VQDLRFNNLNLISVAKHVERNSKGKKKSKIPEKDLIEEDMLLEFFKLISQTDFYLLKEFFTYVSGLYKDPRQEYDY
jgi:hypothetical protein